MKILNIAMSSCFTEGYSYQDNLLSEYQHKLGHSVIVLTDIVTRDCNGQQIITSPCDKVLDNGVRLIRINPGSKMMRILGYFPKITKFLNSIKPDLIFIHGLCSITPIQAIRYKKKNLNTILVADNHQDKYNFKYNKFPFHILLAIWRSGWKRWSRYFNHIYGTTSWRKDFATEYFGIPEEKTDTLLLGVDTDNLSSDIDDARRKIRLNLNLGLDTFVFIHGGKMISDKKTIELMQAFSMIENSDIRLVLFGSVGNDIKDEFNKLKSHDERILYIGYIDSKAVHNYFYAADFCLFPGLHSVLWEESIGCGLPGLYRSFSKNDHTNICGDSISIQAGANSTEIYRIMTKVLNDKNFYSSLKNNAVIASKKLSYYDIARKSIRP